jgi:perosamine synthetase
MRVPLSKPDIGDREIEYVIGVLKSGKLCLGPRLVEFEERFARYVGRRYAVATSSGTAALHLCVRALGIGPRDEVITTSFSFVASANCLLFERALPSFVDIDGATLNIDPREIQTFLEHRCEIRKGVLIDRQTRRSVRAFLPVHVFGLPCDMRPILDLAHQYGVFVIEDACEALGAEYRGTRVGALGDVAVFGFYPNKQITTGEGGMLVTDDEKIARLCRSMRNQGRDEDSGWLRHVRLGYNYRLSDLHCALGLAQLERIDELLRARERVAAAYNRTLTGNKLIALPVTPPYAKRSWFVYVIQIKGPSPESLRNRLVSELRRRGIGCQVYFPPIHCQPYFRRNGLFPSRPLSITESASDRCLALPFFSQATAEEVAHVSEVLHQTLEVEAASIVPATHKAAAHAVGRHPETMKTTPPPPS